MAHKRKVVDDVDQPPPPDLNAIKERLLADTPPGKIHSQLAGVLPADGFTIDLIDIVVGYACLCVTSFDDTSDYLNYLETQRTIADASYGTLHNEDVAFRIARQSIESTRRYPALRDVFIVPNELVVAKHLESISAQTSQLLNYGDTLRDRICRVRQFQRIAAYSNLPPGAMLMVGRSMGDFDDFLSIRGQNCCMVSIGRIGLVVGATTVVTGSPLIEANLCTSTPTATDRRKAVVEFGRRVDSFIGTDVRSPDEKWNRLLVLGCNINEAVICMLFCGHGDGAGGALLRESDWNDDYEWDEIIGEYRESLVGNPVKRPNKRLR